MMPTDKSATAQEKTEQRCWLIECVWQLLVSIDQKARFIFVKSKIIWKEQEKEFINPHYFLRYDTLVNASLGFLSSICQRSQYSAIFEHEEMLKTLYEDVIIKNVMLRKCDFELFEDDPFEYMRKDIEGIFIKAFSVSSMEFLL